MKLRNTLKNSLFTKSLKLVKSNPNKTGLMILFDIMFFISLYGLNRLTQYSTQNLVGTIIAPTLSSAIVLVIFSLIYYLVLLFLYSFFKYSILDFIKSLFGKTEFSFKKLGQFYSLNVIIAVIFLAIMILFSFILGGIKEPYRPFVFIFLAVPYSLFLYIIINISHSLFYEGASIKDTIKKGFKITFTKIKSYRETILIMIVLALVLGILFLGSGYLIRFLASKNYSLYLTAYSYFQQASIIALDVAIYLTILINRISFYAIIKEIK